MESPNFLEHADKILEKIKAGALLTVRSGERLNTMTIGWATFGHMWHKPVFMVAVRSSRYTFEIIEEADDFTVSVPFADMQNQIMFCGTKSGRNVDKFSACNLMTVAGKTVNSPIIEMAGIHFECRIICKTAMNPAGLNTDFENIYPDGDYHTLCFGEILASYETP